MKIQEIQIRDPFVLTDKKENTYYMYGTTDKNCWSGKATGFDVYFSKDLEEWDGPFPVFRPDADFWADENFWAPEVYAYNNKYYMFASFKEKSRRRGTQILEAHSPMGPFVPNSPRPVTPSEWECLDGTLYVDPDGEPWIIFCHEWLQVCDGEICAMKLSKDLTAAVGQPHLLFKGSSPKWSISIDGNINEVEFKGFVTDGPFIYTTENKQLLMLWSGFGAEGYTMGVARSESGGVLGPWTQLEEPLYKKDGGHGMIFRTFDGRIMLTFHTPNDTPNERPIFVELKEVNGKLMNISVT